MTHEKVVAELERKTGLSAKTINRVYYNYWKSIKLMIESLELREDMEEEEFKTVKTSINIPALGKFFCDYYKFKAINNTVKNAKAKENKANV